MLMNRALIEVRVFEELAAAAEWLEGPKAILVPSDDRKWKPFALLHSFPR